MFHYLKCCQLFSVVSCGILRYPAAVPSAGADSRIRRIFQRRRISAVKNTAHPDIRRIMKRRKSAEKNSAGVDFFLLTYLQHIA
jgi:hypothetical protein